MKMKSEDFVFEENYKLPFDIYFKLGILDVFSVIIFCLLGLSSFRL